METNPPSELILKNFAEGFLSRLKVSLAIIIIKNKPKNLTPEEFIKSIIQDYVSNASKWKEKSQCLDHLLNDALREKNIHVLGLENSDTFSCFNEDSEMHIMGNLNSVVSNLKVDFSKLSNDDQELIGNHITSSLNSILKEILTDGQNHNFKTIIKEKMTEVINAIESKLVIGFRSLLRKQIISSIDEQMDIMTQNEYSPVKWNLFYDVAFLLIHNSALRKEIVKNLLHKVIHISMGFQTDNLMGISIVLFHNSYFIMDLLEKIFQYDIDALKKEKRNYTMEGDISNVCQYDDIYVNLLNDSSRKIEELILNLSKCQALYASQLWTVFSHLNELSNCIENKFCINMST